MPDSIESDLRAADPSGFVNLHKPKRWSSHDCVARVRRLLNTKKVGHGGTLDPLATGVLPIAIGRATRLIQYLPSRKAYRAIVRFGLTTSTDDLEGEVLSQQSAAHLQRRDIETLLPQFTGTLVQTPPMFSAVQVGGKRLYDLARKGQQIDVPTREVKVHKLTTIGWQGEQESPDLVLAVDCGPGTYIRALARDLGAAVGTGATLAGLVRTHSNGFDLEESMTLEALESAIAQQTFSPLSAARAVQHLSAATLSPPLAQRWCMGQKLAIAEADISFEAVALDQKSAQIGAPLRIICDQTFLGIGEIQYSDHNEPSHSKHRILVPKMVFTPR